MMGQLRGWLRRERETEKKMVGMRGFEPPTPYPRSRCSTRLSHIPTLRLTFIVRFNLKSKKDGLVDSVDFEKSIVPFEMEMATTP